MLRIKQKYNTAKRLLREKGINFLLVHFFKKYIFRKIFHLVNYLDNKLGFFAIVLFFQEPYFSKGKFTMKINIIAQDKEEFFELIKIAKKNNVKKILEIGTYKGGTALLFSKLLNAEVTSIDIQIPFLRRRILEYISKGKIKTIVGNSHLKETLEKIKENHYDMLFIDGDHSLEGVKKDYEMYSPLVKDNGIIAFHDITSDEGVKKFWRTLSSKGLEIISKENPLGIGVLIKKRNEEELESKQFY
ncbi:MAG: class I SAM-dependent methyltransferase, partial [Candidatus Bathyarchaeia archaeon]